MPASDGREGIPGPPQDPFLEVLSVQSTLLRGSSGDASVPEALHSVDRADQVSALPSLLASFRSVLLPIA